VSVERDLLGKIQIVSSIASAIAIPLVIALVGWTVQANIAEQGLQKDYVSMAVGILTDQNNAEDDKLRKWAVSVLDKTAPVPFTPELREKLQSGEVKFSLIYFPEPQAQLMEPPLEQIPLPEDNPTLGDVFDNAVENSFRYQENATRHQFLVDWVRDTAELVNKENQKLEQDSVQ
jgi:hypothetical protein